MINEEWFRRLRFDDDHHLELGDIRLTIGQQEEILAALMKWKATAEELNDALGLMSRDRNYWHDMATRGGGNG